MAATRLWREAPGPVGKPALPRQVPQAENSSFKVLEEKSVAEADGQGAIPQPAP